MFLCCVRVKNLDLKGGFIFILFATNGHFTHYLDISFISEYNIQ